MKIAFRREDSGYEVSIVFMEYGGSSLVFRIGRRIAGKKPGWVKSLMPYVMYRKYKPLFNFGEE